MNPSKPAGLSGLHGATMLVMHATKHLYSQLNIFIGPTSVPDIQQVRL